MQARRSAKGASILSSFGGFLWDVFQVLPAFQFVSKPMVRQSPGGDQVGAAPAAQLRGIAVVYQLPGPPDLLKKAAAISGRVHQNRLDGKIDVPP